MSLSGRVAFVTGASQGIGRACAVKLATSGAVVAVAARNREKLNELVNEIAAAGDKAVACVLDVTEEEQVKAAIKGVLADHGKIDILVNNAGITRDQLVLRMKRADWDAVLQTNLTSAYLCIQQVISSMLKQRWGRIINIASVFGQMGQAGQANYSASKAGLIGLTMAIGREAGIAQHYLQRGRSRLHRNRHDGGSRRRVQTKRRQTDSSRARGHPRRCGKRGRLPCLGRSILHHRPRAQRERRHADGIEKTLNAEDAEVPPEMNMDAKSYPVTSVPPVLKTLTLTQAESPKQVAQARELFLEYAQSLGFSLCFQNFDQELASLPGDYAPPEGRLMLAEYDGELAACGALHKLDSEICEMKRLYLRPEFSRQRPGTRPGRTHRRRSAPDGLSPHAP
jgi:NAD(P)-dependent dehydrogenase (short-subunit alcohol dehydrogenase family)